MNATTHTIKVVSLQKQPLIQSPIDHNNVERMKHE